MKELWRRRCQDLKSHADVGSQLLYEHPKFNKVAQEYSDRAAAGPTS